MSHRPQTIKGTNRQTVSAADGTSLQRQYLYLPANVWQALQEKARASGVSVSQSVQIFALGGNANSKDKNVVTKQ